MQRGEGAEEKVAFFENTIFVKKPKRNNIRRKRDKKSKKKVGKSFSAENVKRSNLMV
jgi:hypothetical protein